MSVTAVNVTSENWVWEWVLSVLVFEWVHVCNFIVLYVVGAYECHAKLVYSAYMYSGPF